MIAARSHARRSTAVVARAGKDPSSNGGRYYAGKGKYIRDDRGLVSKTGRDDAFTGGFAGGEKGLWAYRDELTEKNAASALEKKKRARRESRELSLAKDFGGLAGGFPGGEIGVKSFNATGAVPEPPAPPAPAAEKASPEKPAKLKQFAQHQKALNRLERALDRARARAPPRPAALKRGAPTARPRARKA